MLTQFGIFAIIVALKARIGNIKQIKQDNEPQSTRESITILISTAIWMFIVWVGAGYLVEPINTMLDLLGRLG